MQVLLLELDGLSLSGVNSIPGWSGLSSDTGRMLDGVELAERLRSKMISLARSPEHLIALRGSVSRLVIEANEMLGPERVIELSLRRLKEALARYIQTAGRFAELAEVADVPAMGIQALRNVTDSIVRQEAQLKSWCDWCRVRDEALALGLGPLADALAANARLKGKPVSYLKRLMRDGLQRTVIDE